MSKGKREKFSLLRGNHQSIISCQQAAASNEINEQITNKKLAKISIFLVKSPYFC